jgi:hypothetical protein
MKRMMIAACVAAMSMASYAQNESPVLPLNKIVEQLNAISKRYVAYQSVMAHSSNVRKAEKRRQDLLNQVTTARQSLADIPYYKGDKALHQATAEYLKVLEYNLNEDYAKIVNMKEIAEQSYDQMEAYLLVKEKISEKVGQAGDNIDSAQIQYCRRHNITIEENGKTELERQLEKIGQVSNYADKVFLIRFKCSIIEQNYLDALKSKNINSMEQLRGALRSYAEEGLAALDTMKGFGGDNTLVNAAKRSMAYFKKAADRYADFTNYYTKEANFERLKQQFDTDRDMRKDKEAINKYNASVKEINEAREQYNNTNDYLNNYRKETYDFWTETYNRFFDSHIPVAD